MAESRNASRIFCNSPSGRPFATTLRLLRAALVREPVSAAKFLKDRNSTHEEFERVYCGIHRHRFTGSAGAEGSMVFAVRLRLKSFSSSEIGFARGFRRMHLRLLRAAQLNHRSLQIDRLASFLTACVRTSPVVVDLSFFNALRVTFGLSEIEITAKIHRGAPC